MLLGMTVENFLSFADKATINFEAGKERLHSKYLASVPKLRKKVVPVGCFFGPNAAGKTNFFKALTLIRRLILEPTEPEQLIPVTPYRLDKVHKAQPSGFVIRFLDTSDNMYTLNLVLTQQEVIQESVVISNSRGERYLYLRSGAYVSFPDFDELSETKKTCLKIAQNNLGPSRLFINRSNYNVFKDYPEFRNIHDWFERLVLVTPDTKYLPVLSPGGLSEGIEELFRDYGLDIDSINLEKYPSDKVPDELKVDILRKLNKDAVIAFDSPFGGVLVVSRENGDVQFSKICSRHRISDTESEIFDFGYESDGTNRVLELSPVLFTLRHPDDTRFVFVIDELDRSLHTLLTAHIVKTFISQMNKKSRAQLLFTAHDPMLLDKSIFRNDQMWLFSKDGGGTQIRRVNEISEVNTDTRLRKFYLQGNLGGIPRVKSIVL